jgi:HNH endonuclease
MSDSQNTAPRSYRPIPGFPGYQVGDDGSIWGKRLSRFRIRKNWRKMSPSPDKDGYLKLILCRDDRTKRYVRLHDIILEVFVGPCPAGMVGAHENGVRNDCRLSNLRWDTQKNNIADKWKHGTYQIGEKASNARLTAEQVREIRRRWAAGGITQVALGKEYGVANVTICAIVTRRIWKHVA